MSTSFNREFLSLIIYFLPILIAVLLGLLFILTKRVRLALLIFVVGAGVQYAKGVAFFQKTSEVQAGIKIITHSLMSSNTNQNLTISNLIAKKPDVLALQEVSDLGETLKILKANGYQVAYKESKHTVLATHKKIESFHFEGNILVASVKFNNHYMRFWVLHAPKFTLNIDLHNTFFSGLYNSLSKINFSNDDYIDIVLGDFNSLSTGYWRVKLQSLGFTGALSDLGSGLLNTFPAEGRIAYFPALISIDEIYIEGNPKGLGSVAKSSLGSDHYPVMFVGDIN